MWWEGGYTGENSDFSALRGPRGQNASCHDFEVESSRGATAAQLKGSISARVDDLAVHLDRTWAGLALRSSAGYPLVLRPSSACYRRCLVRHQAIVLQRSCRCTTSATLYHPATARSALHISPPSEQQPLNTVSSRTGWTPAGICSRPAASSVRSLPWQSCSRAELPEPKPRRRCMRESKADGVQSVSGHQRDYKAVVDHPTGLFNCMRSLR